MADFSALKTSIQNYIKQNGNEEITGNLLQQVLLSMVTTLGDSAINDLVTALNAEIANRGNADTTLQGNIDNEATARGNADTELGGRITTLQGVVNGIVANVENGYVYAGIATPSTTPVSGKVFYLALTAGTYTNFGATIVPQGINILKYKGSAWSLDSFLGLDDAPTQGSSNLVKSGGVLDSIIKDGSAFDLSAYNSGTTYTDLSAALTALNALPAAYKKGGMSMKFVQSSDNKYVQARCMAQNFTTDVTQWQGVDDEPTAGSENLVKSGGINKKISQTKEALAYSITNYTQKNYSIKVNGKFGIVGTEKHAVLPVVAGSEYIIRSADNTNTRYAFATSGTEEYGGNIPLVSGTSVVELVPNDIVWVKIPEGCTYLLVNIGESYPFNVSKVMLADEAPTEESKNLVKSGGVYQKFVEEISFFNLTYTTNFSTTVLQVSLNRRKSGVIVTYKNNDKLYMYQYFGAYLTDTAWSNSLNWIRINSLSNQNKCFNFYESSAVPNTDKIINAVSVSLDVTGLSDTAIRDGSWFIRTLELSGTSIVNMVLGNVDTNNTYHPYNIITNSVVNASTTINYYNNKKNAVIYYSNNSVKALFVIDLETISGLNYSQYHNPVDHSVTTIRLSNNVLNSIIPLVSSVKTLDGLDLPTVKSDVTNLKTESTNNEYRFYEYKDKVHSHNLINTNELIFGKAIQGTTGAEIDDANSCCTPYIRVKAGTYYSFGLSPIVVYNKKKVRQTAYYSNTQGNLSFTIGSDSYIRCSSTYTQGTGNPSRMYVSPLQKNGPFFEKTDISNDNHIDIRYNLQNDSEKFGIDNGVVVSGTYGSANTVYRLPLRFDGKETIDFDFILGRDINVASSEQDKEIMLDINDEGAKANQLSTLSMIIKAIWWYKNPSIAYCFPDYNTILQTSLGTAGNRPRPLGDYMRNSMNGEDAFSIRKLTVTSEEVGITAENNGTSFIIATSDGTPIHSFPYSTYETIESLVAAINETGNYEAILYDYQGKNCEDLAKLKIKITDLFQPKNYASENLGSAVPDSFETFFPLSSIGCRHHFRLTIEEKEASVEVYSYLDGYPIGYLSIGRANGLPYLYIGGSANGNSVFSGKIENLRIRNEIVEPSHGLAIMAHEMYDTSIETPSSEGGGAKSIRAFDKMLTEIQDRGYTFIDSETFLGIQNGNLHEGEYPHKYAVIFIDDFHPEAYSVPLYRSVFNKHDCKPILPVIFKDLETATEAELQAFKMAKSAGWSIWMHSYSHSVSAQGVGGMNWETFTAMVDKYYTYPKTYLGFDVNAIIYPGNYSDNRTRKALKNRGFIAGGSGWNDQRCYAGIDQMQFARISNLRFFDTGGIDNIDTILASIKQT